MGNVADELVRRFFRQMQCGAAGEHEMMALFAEDAVYIEPFSGKERTHHGKEAIREVMREGWRNPLPDMRIVVEQVDVSGDVVHARWTCHSPALPGGKGSGENEFTLRDGLIARLVVRFLPSR